jgi:hypothetical protein
MLVVWTVQDVSRTHVFLRYSHPDLESARTTIWDRPGKDGRKGKQPKSLGRLLGKAKWGKPLADWIMATGVGLLGQKMWDGEADRVADGGVSHFSKKVR